MTFPRPSHGEHFSSVVFALVGRFALYRQILFRRQKRLGLGGHWPTAIVASPILRIEFTL